MAPTAGFGTFTTTGFATGAGLVFKTADALEPSPGTPGEGRVRVSPELLNCFLVVALVVDNPIPAASAAASTGAPETAAADPGAPSVTLYRCAKITRSPKSTVPSKLKSPWANVFPLPP